MSDAARVAVVTGASRGAGRGIATALELAQRYGIVDERGRRPPSHREMLGAPRAERRGDQIVRRALRRRRESPFR